MRVPEDRVSVIDNAIDIGNYSRQRSRSDAKRELGIPAQRLVIGAVGRLAAEKAFDNLIRSTDRLIEEGLDVQLLIAGEGEKTVSFPS